MRKRGVLSLVAVGIAAAMLLAGSAAVADHQYAPNQLLRGDYAFSGETSCLVSEDGFNPNLTPVGSPAPFPTVISFGVQGIRTFNGDGTGTIVARVVSFRHPYALPTSPTPVFNRGGASSSDIEAEFTYQVGPDRTFTAQMVSFNATVLTGPRTGQTFTVTNFPDFFGHISNDLKTLTLSHIEPTVETQSFSNGDVDQRICSRPRIAIKLKGGHDHDN